MYTESTETQLVLPLPGAGQGTLPPWVIMWTLAFAIFIACKWLTYRRARRAGVTTTASRALIYLCVWPGMDAVTFLDARRRPLPPTRREWFSAMLNAVLGVALIWGGVRTAVAAAMHPLAVGWIGMIGTIFFLHFGAFSLLSLAWRRAGIDAAPIMRAPILSRSLAEFWSARWNTAFHELSREFLYRPLRRLIASPFALFLVFVISGFVHDLVISLPAGAGYGLPTAYFALQGLGVLAERSVIGRRQFRLGDGVRGRAFALVITAAPAFYLFHPPFVKTVMLPFLSVIGAQ